MRLMTILRLIFLYHRGLLDLSLIRSIFESHFFFDFVSFHTISDSRQLSLFFRDIRSMNSVFSSRAAPVKLDNYDEVRFSFL